MRIQFEIKEKLPEIIQEILHSDKWQTSVKEEISGRTTVVIRDQAYGSEATIDAASGDRGNSQGFVCHVQYKSRSGCTGGGYRARQPDVLIK